MSAWVAVLLSAARLAPGGVWDAGPESQESTGPWCFTHLALPVLLCHPHLHLEKSELGGVESVTRASELLDGVWDFNLGMSCSKSGLGVPGAILRGCPPPRRPSPGLPLAALRVARK